MAAKPSTPYTRTLRARPFAIERSEGHFRAALKQQIVRIRLGSALEEMYVDTKMLEELDDTPVIVVANHMCALDAAVAMRTAHDLGRQLRLAVAPVLLERHPVLSRFGAFPVIRGDAMASARSLRSVGKRLNRTTAGMVWFFPQGGHVRSGCEVTCERGALAVAGGAPLARIVPVALHYEMFESSRPFAWLKAGGPLSRNDIGASSLDAVLREISDQLKHDLSTGASSYRPLLRAGTGRTLLQNVPCDRGRLETAVAAAGLPTTVLDALHPGAAPIGPSQTAKIAAAVQHHEGSFYGQLVRRSLSHRTT